MRVVVIGNREFTRHVFLHATEHADVVGVVGPDMDRHGGPVGARTLRELALDVDCAVIATEDINSDESVDRLRSLEPDLCLCAGWTQIVSDHVLSIPRTGFLGLHASLLPKNRGGAPVNWSIIRGDDRVGLSLFEFTSEVDAGDVYAQTSVPIEPRDDVSTVYAKLSVAAGDLLERTIRAIEEGASPDSQSSEEATYLPQRKPTDGLIEWEWTTDQLADWVRALTDPYPGAFSFLNGQRLTVRQTTPDARQACDVRPGTVLKVRPGEGIDVSTGNGILRVERVQLDDGPRLWADDLAATGVFGEGTVLGTDSDFPDVMFTDIRGPEGRFDFQTNVPAGTTATFLATCRSHRSQRDLRISVSVDGQSIRSTSELVSGRVDRSFEIPVSTTGSHTARIEFEEDGTVVDSRVIKLYGSSPG